MIRIICLGSIKEKYLKDGINDYLKRISKYHKLEIIELKDNIDIKKEEDQILKVLNPKHFNIALDIDGNQMGSLDLAKFIDSKFMYYADVTFVIGASNGLSERIKNKMNLKLSFGKITMPHGLFRLVLLEQIYRSFKINNNESYHK